MPAGRDWPLMAARGWEKHKATVGQPETGGLLVPGWLWSKVTWLGWKIVIGTNNNNSKNPNVKCYFQKKKNGW